MAYRIILKPAALKDLEALPATMLSRVDASIRALADTPRPPGAKKLKDESGLWRQRVGDYRVLYRIDDAAEAVTVARVRHRREAYR